MKTHILCPITFFRKSHRLWDNVEKYSGDRGATNDVTIWRTRVACWISKDIRTYAYVHAHAPPYPHTRTHEQACTHRQICNTYCFSTRTVVSRTRLYYVIRTLPVLFWFTSHTCRNELAESLKLTFCPSARSVGASDVICQSIDIVRDEGNGLDERLN
jgi:hypothetical protein